MNKIIAAILVLIAVGLGGFLMMRNTTPDNAQVACTMEAKLCPDGSYVGRSGPNCEFAACPTVSASATNSRIETRIDQGTSALGLKITPKELVEDSRCPVDVQCIQAGTVRVRAQVESASGTSEQTFKLNESVTLAGKTITLVEVSPIKRSTVQTGPKDYVFYFEMKTVK